MANLRQKPIAVRTSRRRRYIDAIEPFRKQFNCTAAQVHGVIQDILTKSVKVEEELAKTKEELTVEKEELAATKDNLRIDSEANAELRAECDSLRAEIDRLMAESVIDESEIKP